MKNNYLSDLLLPILFCLFVCLNFQIGGTERVKRSNTDSNDFLKFLLHSLKPTGSSPPTCPPLYVYEFMHCCTQTIYMPDTKQSSLSLYITVSHDEIPLTRTHTHTLFPSVKVQSKAVQLLRLCSVCARYNPDIAHPRSLKYDCTAVLP